jgi:hypothetical protein
VDLRSQGIVKPLSCKLVIAELIVHINREVMHHGAEICLLRDLYRAIGATTRDSRLLPQR